MLWGLAAQVGQEISGVADEGRLAAFTALGDWGQIWAIGFNEEAVVGCGDGCFANLFGILERDHPIEGQVPAQAQVGFSFAGATGKAVDDPGDPRMFAENTRHVGMRVANVNDDRQIMSFGHIELLMKALLLDRWGIQVVVVVIEADFPQGDAVPFRQEDVERSQCLIEGRAGFVAAEGIKTGSNPDQIRMRRGNGKGLTSIRNPGADADGAHDSGFTDAVDHGIAIRIEALGGEVTVGIDEGADHRDDAGGECVWARCVLAGLLDGGGCVGGGHLLGAVVGSG